jgi:hypothetical protein
MEANGSTLHGWAWKHIAWHQMAVQYIRAWNGSAWHGMTWLGMEVHCMAAKDSVW